MGASLSTSGHRPSRLCIFKLHQVIADGLSSVDHPVSMDKILYLSERMFYQEGTTDAGYLDQCGKLRNQLGGMSQVGAISFLYGFHYITWA